MALKNGIGISDYTPIKTKLYSDLVEKELGAIKGIFLKHGNADWKRNNVLIIDTTAGCGYNKVGGELFKRKILGSPFIVLDKIIKPGWSMLNFKLICIEKKGVNANSLREIRDSYDLPHNVSVEIIRANNRVALDEIYKRELIKKSNWQYGWIYNDPSGNIPEFDYLETLSNLRQFKTLDFIINIPTTTLLRVACAPQCIEDRRLDEYLDELNKNFWWLNETPRSKHKWAMAFGSNWDGWKLGHIGINGKHRFIRVDSDYGQEILFNLSTTKKEREEKNAHI